MTNKKSTKRALLMSALSLLLCVSMLIGTTFAWFTDEVKSTGNVIQSGKLDAEMWWKNPGAADWTDASTGAIYNYQYWEPGYTDVKYIKLVNAGNLAFKYQLNVVPNDPSDDTLKLAEVIDVYCSIVTDVNADLTRTGVEGMIKLGTLLELMTNPGGADTGILLPTEGNKQHIDPEAITDEYYTGEVIVCLGLKMRESANNDYQNLSVGNGFTVQLLATQYTYENDSFGPDYDKDAPKLFMLNGELYDTAELAIAAAEPGDKLYFSAATAPIVINKAVELTISNCNIVAGEGENAITVNADATINVENGNVLKGGKNGDGIYVAENVTLKLTGSGNLYTSGNEEKEYFRNIGSDDATYGESVSNTMDATFANTCGSGIYVAGDIVIDGLAGLVAKGYGALNDQSNSGFGIGGTTDSIVIKNSTVNYARGGFVCPEMFIPDWAGHFYGKREPTGAPAIGSMTQGAEITIENSTVVKAEGGSKGAGIGARYHTGVKVTISNSDVTAFGGNGSAGIGGSRVDGNPQPHHAITVEITNSTVNATGGDYAAGIGSGYNTHDKKMNLSPATTVKIDAASNITAKGGMLGAGIGTGHNVLNFVGDIKCDTTNVKAGYNVDDCCHGALCSDVEDVGLGAYKIESRYNKIADGLYQDNTDATKYYVYNANGLTAFAESVNRYSNYEYPYQGEVVNLMNDIDLGGMEWTPIGDYRFSANRFCGTFDGQGHTISNFQITKKTDKNDADKSSYGFFGNVEGTVKNLTIDNATVNSYAYTGALIGRLTGGTVENCHVKNSSVKCSYWQAGGMIGQLNDGCVVSGCTITNTTVTGASAIGGLVGPITAANKEGTDTLLFENCSVTGCHIIQEGSFGANYDNMFGGMFADVDVKDNLTNINNCSVENTTVKGAESSALFNTVSGSKVYIDGAVLVTPTNVSNLTFASDTDYMFSGNFSETTITVPAGLNNVVLDGTHATFDGHVKVTFNRIADGYNYVTEDRTGSYVLKNFKVNDSLSIGVCSVTSLTVSGCEVEMMDFNASNTAVTLKDNKITRVDTAAYTRYDGGSNDKTLYFYADNYDLVMTGNVITDTVATKNLVVIQGEYQQYQAGKDITWSNSVSMTGNTLTCVNDSVVKIYNDVTYAPVAWPADYEITAAAQELAAQLFGSNTVNKESNAVIEILCRAQGKDDLEATEFNNDVLAQIAAGN